MTRIRICPNCNKVNPYRIVKVPTIVEFRGKFVKIQAKVFECIRCWHQVTTPPEIYDSTAEVLKEWKRMNDLQPTNLNKKE